MNSAVLSAVEAALAIKYPFSTPTSFSRQIFASCGTYYPPPGTSQSLLGCQGGAADAAIAFAATYSIPQVISKPYLWN